MEMEIEMEMVVRAEKAIEFKSRNQIREAHTYGEN
jgi:hypothetical protein